MMRDDIVQRDQQHRQIALDPQISCIVRAAAGSGKTELLIQRFLRLLSGVTQPEQIVAITFTRQAAAEMRQRIINVLQQAQSSEPPALAHQQRSWQLAREALAQAQRHEWNLIDNPSRLRIQTIDSLCASIAQQAPLLSGLGGQSQISTQVKALYMLAAERSLMALDTPQQWTPALRQLLQHLDNELPRLKRLLADMLANRDQWLRHINDDQTDRHTIEEALQNIFAAHVRRATTAIQARSGQQPLLQLLRYAAHNLLDSQSDISHCIELTELPTADRSSLKQWQGLIELLLTKQDKWRSSISKAIGFPPGDAHKTQLKELIEQYETHADLKDSLSTIRRLASIGDLDEADDGWLSNQQWKIIQALCQLLVVTETQLRIVFSERHETDFINVQQSALQALHSEQQPTELALKLDYAIQHLLIDEFQDISVSQYKLLEQLTEGWTGGDGRSLFVVGDPMQSIYRFREAEVGKFLSIYQQQRLGQVILKPLSLHCNYRSQSSIVSWINDAFARILPQQADVLSGAVNYSEVIAADSTVGGQVINHPQLQQVESTSDTYIRRQEAQQISDLITDLQKKSTHASIAILAANRSHLSEIINCLQRDNIPLQALDMQSLHQRSAIQDCLALTRALLHPADRIAWLAILRAPWAGLSLQDLQRLVAADSSDMATIWELMQRVLEQPSLSERGQQQLAKITPILDKALANRRRRPLRRLVEMVWLEIGGPATLIETVDLDNVKTYFELLQRHEKAADLGDFDSFIQALEQCYAAIPLQNNQLNDRQPVQIMTIHRAKGLEFDIVILPGLHRRGRADSPPLLRWQEQQQEDGSHSLLLAPIGARTATAEDPLYSYLADLAKHKLQHERGRLLYVATTRAKQQLHLFAAARLKESELQSPHKGTLLEKLWPMVSADYQSAIALQADVQPTKTAATIDQHQYRRHSGLWQCPMPPADMCWQPRSTFTATDVGALEYQWANDPIRHIGTVVHEQLHYFSKQTQLPDHNDIKAQQRLYENALKQQGVAPKELKVAVQQVVTALVNTISDQYGQWLLSDQHQQAQSEYALTGMCPQTGNIISIRIDRTFIDEQGDRWIIDYKTSRHQGTDLDVFLDQQQQRYTPQLEKYAQLISYQQSAPIKLGLYFPLLKAWRAWPYNIVL